MTNQVRIQLSSALAKVTSKVAQVADLEVLLAQTQDDREASEVLVNIFAEKLKAAAAEKKELKEELAALENTVCELEDRLDAAIDEADADDDDRDFAERLSPQRRLELARSWSALHAVAATYSSNKSTQSNFSASKLCRARSPAS